MKMTSFELLKDLDKTSLAISYICFKTDILFNIIKENVALFDFMPCCYTFQIVLHRESILISSRRSL